MNCWLWVLAGWGLLPAASAPPGPEYVGDARPPGEVRRIVSLAPNLTEMIFSLGAGGRVVGVTRFDDFPPEVAKLPKVGGFIDPSLEAILALRPELVVCVPNPMGRDRMEALTRMGVAVLVLPDYRLDDIFVNVSFLGKLLNAGEQAEAIAACLRGRLDGLKRRTTALSRPKVLWVYGKKPLVVAGSETFADELLRVAGGENVVGQSAVRYPTLPMEEVIRLAPQVIIDASMNGTAGETSPEEATTFWARWAILPAVKTGRVHGFDSALWFRPGPRIGEGLERLFDVLHPEVSLPR